MYFLEVDAEVSRWCHVITLLLFFVFWNYEGLIAWKGNYLVAYRQGFWIFFAFRSQARYVHCQKGEGTEKNIYLSLVCHFDIGQGSKLRKSLSSSWITGEKYQVTWKKNVPNLSLPRDSPPFSFEKKNFGHFDDASSIHFLPFDPGGGIYPPSWLVFRPPLLSPPLSFPLAALRRWSKTHPPFPFLLFKKRKMQDRKRKRKRWGIRPLTLAGKKVAQSANIANFLHCKHKKTPKNEFVAHSFLNEFWVNFLPLRHPFSWRPFRNVFRFYSFFCARPRMQVAFKGVQRTQKPFEETPIDHWRKNRCLSGDARPDFSRKRKLWWWLYWGNQERGQWLTRLYFDSIAFRHTKALGTAGNRDFHWAENILKFVCVKRIG